ncbi:hypothetical protein BV898_15705 [Hypsibius exemplaris]|uniref:Carrier domain-containing protein n=1 Tax=Hypsibius exemplaris TaxID=2072580 RepID=A0A9X6NBM7_HYPEX|nr:hypothetical protein BV898_15705 [Hypsibius exemplaris]
MSDDYAPSPWDNFTTVVADTLGIPCTSIDPSNNFQEMGGNSLNIVSAVLKLQESGFQVTVEQFMQAGSMEKLFLSATATNGITTSGHHFSLKALKDVDANEAQTLLAKSFLSKSELFAKCGDMEVADFLFAYVKWWEAFSAYSFAVVDEQSKLRAVALAADQIDLARIPPDAKTHSHFMEVFRMLSTVTKETRTKLNPTGVERAVLCKFMFGASLENTAEENVTAFALIEKELMDTARKGGFSFTIAENISPLTQQLSQYLGCRRYATIQMNTWADPEGNRPFANCSDDYSLTVDVYEVVH